jgi:hypothetical protein
MNIVGLRQRASQSRLLFLAFLMLFSSGQIPVVRAQAVEPDEQSQQSAQAYFDDFGTYTPGSPPAGWLLRGTDGITPTIEEVGGSGPGYRWVSFPEVPWQYWDKWLLKPDLVLSSHYIVTVKMNFQNSVADRAGLTIAWDDASWNRIDIQPNVYWDDIEFRVAYTGPLPSNVNVANTDYIPIHAFTDYWLRVEAFDHGPGQGQVNVYWSTDGTNFTQVITATGLATVTGLAGISTAGPHMPHTHFDDFSILDNGSPGITISGNAGTAGAILSYTDGVPKTAAADGNGSYSFSVPSGWSGTVTPSKAGYTFSPPDRAYANVQSDQTNQNYTATSTPLRPPLVIVHGWRGFPPQLTGCTDARYQPVSAEVAKGYFQGGIERLKADGGYRDSEIVYARLVSNPCFTPPLENNVPHLMAAIDAAKAANPGQSKVILIAHSMGGLVARAYIEGPRYRDDVQALFTFGSPHLGAPADALTFLLNGITLGNICQDRQPAACEFSAFGMALFNLRHHRNRAVTYHAITGDAPFFGRSPKGMAMAALIVGPDDGIVPTFSGRATLLGTFDRWITDEVHGEVFGGRSYFIRDGGASTSYSQCIKKVLVDGAVNCGVVTIASAVEEVPAALAQHSPIQQGTLQSGQTATFNISHEGGPALFTSQWQSGTLSLTLIAPDGQTIDPAFASANPGAVSYVADASAATYYLPSAAAGTWQVVITAVNLPPGGTTFSAFAAFDSNVSLTGSTDSQWYTPGATAAITAAIAGSPAAATVTGIVVRADTVIDTLTFSPVGNGQYRAMYTVPDVPGYAEVRLSAAGTTASSQPFERGTTLALQISSNRFGLTDSYSDTPSPYAGSSLYQALHVSIGVNAASSGTVGLSADLVDNNGSVVAHAVTMQDLPAGAHTLTLQFQGVDLFASQRNGPYTLTNVLLTDETSVTLISEEANSVYSTAAYLYTDFAAPGSFADVPATYWASGFIERLYAAGVTGGCAVNPARYCPEDTVTRAQMAVFLLRGIHTSSYMPPTMGAGSGFNDVPPDYWSGTWIKQLAAEGITAGCGNGNYCPEHPVTRAQMAVFLLRSKYGASYVPPAVGSGTGFADVLPNYWAAAFIKQLVAEGITVGCGNGSYCPEQPVTRAQMAVFLVRTFNLP